MQAALPMGGNKVTGAADPTVSTDLATKNYVDTSTASFFSTGDGKITLKTVADSGWILCDDGTFGSASSGASNLASGTTLALFTLFFNNLSDTAAPLLTAGGGATTRAGQTNAATAWAANCRMTLLKQLGRAIAGAGTGAGLTARPLGSSVGEETHLLTLTELPTGITSSGSASSFQADASTNNFLFLSQVSGSFDFAAGNKALRNGSQALGSVNTTSNNTGGGAHNNIQPSTFWNVEIKL